MLDFMRAAGVATALLMTPVAASAVTLDPANTMADGGTYDILAGPYFFDATFVADDVAGMFEFQFTNTSATTQTVGVTWGTVLQGTLEFLGGVAASWLNGQSATVAQGVTGTFQISTVLAAGQTDTLRVVYGDPKAIFENGKGNIDMAVAAVAPVPLPAGGLLLLGALGGMAALRRRKAKAKA